VPFKRAARTKAEEHPLNEPTDDQNQNYETADASSFHDT
jgi:hypothetical protein